MLKHYFLSVTSCFGCCQYVISNETYVGDNLDNVTCDICVYRCDTIPTTIQGKWRFCLSKWYESWQKKVRQIVWNTYRFVLEYHVLKIGVGGFIAKCDPYCTPPPKKKEKKKTWNVKYLSCSYSPVTSSQIPRPDLDLSVD